ncbi:MAG: 4-hydroxythreonine-4-phosphate dehydrogenase [Gammaproteobacteria bacterium SG8_30]|jgi:4-hydroxythreonine-4-phosphate dehydrogenase|nr:MAG: 4-hydroxythreonine-4-phosphate dehydrogenase [Gammaproteobacteria bacterium SG8_30]
MTVRRLVITSGEPAGIGPDICLAVSMRDWPCELVVAGDPALLESRARQLGLEAELARFVPGRAARPHRGGRVDVLPFRTAVPVEPGRLDAANASYVLAMLDAACDGCYRGEFDAMVTAPVQKSVINEAGVTFAGHTEYLAARLGCRRPVMLLVAGSLRVALATTHVPLAAVPGRLSRDLIADILRVLDDGLRQRFHLPGPRILVCGLNPHAGEAGHLGREEIDFIGPAVEAARRAGIDARGPVPADTAFTPVSLAHADAVLAMFHDQGLPVLKHAGFGRGVNVTLGLPIVRTSVDHGTALELAGTGRADPGSLVAAVELALGALP